VGRAAGIGHGAASTDVGGQQVSGLASQHKSFMRGILKRTAYLFWQYPILWLPVLLADFIKYWFSTEGRHVGHVASFALLNNSVLGNTPEVPTGARLVWFYVVSGGFTWGARFIGVASYCYALGVLTRAISGSNSEHEFAGMDAPTTGHDPAAIQISAIESTATSVRLDWAPPKKWLRYSALVLFASALALLVGVLITTYCFRSQFRRWDVDFSWSVTVGALFGALLAIAPVLSFISNNLTPQSGGRPDILKLKHPRFLAFVTALAFGVVYSATWWFSVRIFNSAINQIAALRTPILSYVTAMVSSLVVAIPFIPGMIVLILIRQDELRSKIEIASGSDLSIPSVPFLPLEDGTADAPSEN